MQEASSEDTPFGRYVTSEGWFVLNLGEALAVRNEAKGGSVYPLEGRAAPFGDFGVNVRVLAPGEPNAMYHSETGQEGFLVLSGECILLVEGEERPLKPWDFVHFPPNTGHAFVATGDTPCVIVMTGARSPEWPEKGIVYPRSELALRHGVGVETETSSPVEALAPFPKWHLRRPDDWNALPWS
jgi:uncharacterized cupin superfamily protein